MDILAKLKQWWRFTKLVWQDEPIRSWRKLENGNYMCDGDCGRWSLHGVCTCGLCHFFKPTSDRHSKIERDNESWHREYQTGDIMMHTPYENNCSHGLSWNDKCVDCHKDLEEAMTKFFEEWNQDDKNS
jgi:hypothetical protein